MNPALLLCLMVCPLAFAAAGGLFYAEQVFAALVFVIIGIWPLGIAGWQIIKFTNDSPDRLQREEHLERMFEMKSQLVVREGDKLKSVPISDHLTGNPQIEDKRDE